MRLFLIVAVVFPVVCGRMTPGHGGCQAREPALQRAADRQVERQVERAQEAAFHAQFRAGLRANAFNFAFFPTQSFAFERFVPVPQSTFFAVPVVPQVVQQQYVPAQAVVVQQQSFQTVDPCVNSRFVRGLSVGY